MGSWRILSCEGIQRYTEGYRGTQRDTEFVVEKDVVSFRINSDGASRGATQTSGKKDNAVATTSQSVNETPLHNVRGSTGSGSRGIIRRNFQN